MTDAIRDVAVVSDAEYGASDDISLKVRFSVQGASRNAFNETNWTKAYDANDVAIKIRYGVRLWTGGLRKKTLGKQIESYKKAAIFWTRNPKLVNAVKERRIWVQVARNFTPIIRLSEGEVRSELFDFEETITVRSGELGPGTHPIGGEVYVSWQKHHFLERVSLKGSIPDSTITIN